MTTYRTNARCPWCGLPNGYTKSGTPGAAPGPGMISFCWECQRIAVFHIDALSQLNLRRPTPEEAYQLHTSPIVQDLRRRLAELKREASSHGTNPDHPH